ncbi:MAG: hypothetical protein IKR78_05840 [Dehalococcoidales bacterium]|nr:hypothetical protein [Dehalococcoidales bacterium]
MKRENFNTSIEWPKELQSKIEAATKDMPENIQKDWMVERLLHVAYHVNRRPDCTVCQEYKPQVEALCDYLNGAENKSYDEQREYLIKLSLIIKHLSVDHKMVNKGQFPVVGTIVGLVFGVIMGAIRHNFYAWVIPGIIVGLLMGIIYERNLMARARVL